MSLSRRDLLKGGVLAAGAAALPRAAEAAEKNGGSATPAELKFCVFADIHYYPGRFVNSTIGFMEKILDRAAATGCDMVIELGDFCHNPVKCGDYVDRYNDFRIKSYHVLGNHETDIDTHEQVLDCYRMEKPYYHFDVKGFRFIACDTNYIRYADGSYRHYSAGSNMQRERKKHLGCANNQMNPEQFEWLKDAINTSPNPCVLCSHASFERSDGVDGAEKVRAIIDAANAETPGKVRLAMNGHHHANHLRIMNGVLYFDVNSASHLWYGRPHKAYPPEFVAKYSTAPHMIGYKDPLSAIVTLGPDGHFKIEGSRTEFLFGITPAMAGYGGIVEPGNRYIDPAVIEDVDLRMNYTQRGSCKSP